MNLLSPGWLLAHYQRYLHSSVRFYRFLLPFLLLLHGWTMWEGPSRREADGCEVWNFLLFLCYISTNTLKKQKKKNHQFLTIYDFILSRLAKLPSCLLVILIAVPVDVLLITAVALWKSPYMLFRGWKRLLEDLIGREGPFLETVCVPFAGLAIILWPLAVLGAVIGAIISSFFLALYSGVIVHQVCHK